MNFCRRTRTVSDSRGGVRPRRALSPRIFADAFVPPSEHWILQVALTLFFAAAPLLFASTSAAEDDLIGVSAAIENDIFVLNGKATDRWYTNGLRFTASFKEPNEKHWSRVFASWWCHSKNTACGNNPRIGYSYGVGQNMYTPTNIQDPHPQPFDRPWAGWLYSSARLDIESSIGDGDWTRDNFEAQLGVVGPSSRAGDLQKWLHTTIGGKTPKGWDNQLRDELGLNILYIRNLRLFHSHNFDVIPYYAIAVGKVITSLGAGAIARLGYGLSGFGPENILSSGALTGLLPVQAATRSIFENIWIREC